MDPAPVSVTMGSPVFGYSESRPLLLADPLGLWSVDSTCKNPSCQNQYPCDISIDPKGVLAGIEDSSGRIREEGSPCAVAIAEVGAAEGIGDLPGCLRQNMCGTDSGPILECNPCQFACGSAVVGNVALGGPINPNCGQSPGQGQGYGPTLLHEAMHLCGMRGDVPAGSGSANAKRLERQWRRIEWACFQWNVPGAAH